MASFRGHLAFSASLGAAYGALSYWQLGLDWGTAALCAGITAVGGMLPDLDSDSGVPVREMFGLAGVFIPLILLRRFVQTGWDVERILVLLGVTFVRIRYGLAFVFKRLTVHRGMFHSIPGMLIAGIATFLMYKTDSLRPRLFISAGVTIGFFSHLLLDEICAVDFRGLKPKLNQFAGSALKFGSKSYWATGLTYLTLLVLCGLVVLDVTPSAPARQNEQAMQPPAVSMPPQGK
jgi:membrane-bound metal-dependent hydrolase YbcI (DUF457 family)